jgi:tetratricopeptide (TPR) repeat protein
MRNPGLPAAFLLFLFSAWIAGADSYSSYMRRGTRNYNNELYGEALQNYRMGKLKNGKAIEPDFNEGCASFKMEDYVNALRLFEEALGKNPSRDEAADIYYNMGNSYARLEDWPNAVQSYVKGLEIHPYDLSLKHNLELALKELKQSQRQRDDQARNESPPGDREGAGTQKNDEKAREAPTGNSPASENPESSAGSGSPETGKQLTREEAQRLINSLGAGQDQTIGDLIKSRIGDETNEKNW